MKNLVNKLSFNEDDLFVNNKLKNKKNICRKEGRSLPEV